MDMTDSTVAKNNAMLVDLNCDRSLSYSSNIVFTSEYLGSFFPPYLGVNTALVYQRAFLADVSPLHTSPTDIISCLDQPALTQVKGLGSRHTTKRIWLFSSCETCLKCLAY